VCSFPANFDLGGRLPHSHGSKYCGIHYVWACNTHKQSVRLFCGRSSLVLTTPTSTLCWQQSVCWLWPFGWAAARGELAGADYTYVSTLWAVVQLLDQICCLAAASRELAGADTIIILVYWLNNKAGKLCWGMGALPLPLSCSHSISERASSYVFRLIFCFIYACIWLIYTNKIQA
jgi:hypothetical protein